MTSDRILVLAAGLCGAAGVALSAAAAHGGAQNTGTAATFLLAHAPAFLAAGLIGAGNILRWSAMVLLVGVVLFSGDLFSRDLLGSRLFPMSAPAGGMLMIVGWLGVAVSAYFRRPL